MGSSVRQHLVHEGNISQKTVHIRRLWAQAVVGGGGWVGYQRTIYAVYIFISIAFSFKHGMENINSNLINQTTGIISLDG